MSKRILICCCCILLCSMQLRAQNESWPGTYRHELKHPNGQVDEISFTLKPDHKAIYRKQNPALEQDLIKDNGSWQYDKQKQTVTVIMAATKDEEGNALPEVKVTFKAAGTHLQVISASPPATGKSGDVFEKVQQEK